MLVNGPYVLGIGPHVLGNGDIFLQDWAIWNQAHFKNDVLFGSMSCKIMFGIM